MHCYSGKGPIACFVVVAIATANAAGCMLYSMSTLGGGPALRRAAREFSCPPDKVGVLKRPDIADGLFDVDACGQRARYMCTLGPTDVQCISEPVPARWDQDPALCRNPDRLAPKPAGCFEPSREDPSRDDSSY